MVFFCCVACSRARGIFMQYHCITQNTLWPPLPQQQTQANIHNLEAVFRNSAFPTHSLSDFLSLQEAPVLSCPLIQISLPLSSTQIVIPVSQRAKLPLSNKEPLSRLFLFFTEKLIMSLFISEEIFYISVFFHSEFNFRPSVDFLAAGHER